MVRHLSSAHPTWYSEYKLKSLKYQIPYKKKNKCKKASLSVIGTRFIKSSGQEMLLFHHFIECILFEDISSDAYLWWQGELVSDF